jgi:hypothetical protein
VEEFDRTHLDPELMVSDDTKKERLVICISCESFEAPLCNECGCLVGIMTAYTFKSCPKGKW